MNISGSVIKSYSPGAAVPYTPGGSGSFADEQVVEGEVLNKKAKVVGTTLHYATPAGFDRRINNYLQYANDNQGVSVGYYIDYFA